ncbi:MAG: hypothetical protein ACYSSO_08940 [Planctomycetota bacterium]|jgi:hypothetical protein
MKPYKKFVLSGPWIVLRRASSVLRITEASLAYVALAYGMQEQASGARLVSF